MDCIALKYLMKKIVLLIALDCFVQIASAQTSENCLNDFGLKGNVKEITDFTYRGSINETNPDNLKHPEKSIIKFDKDGNELEESVFDMYGKISSKSLFIYKEDKSVVKNQYDGNGMLQGRYVFKYNEKGNKTEFDTYYGPELKLVSKVIYKHDANGNKIEEDTYDAGRFLTEKAVFRYNEKNQKVEGYQGWFLPNVNKKERLLFKYDDPVNQITSDIYDLSGKLTGENSTTLSNIDDQGNWQVKLVELKGYGPSQENILFKNITKRSIKYY